MKKMGNNYFEGINIRKLLEESHFKFISKKDLPEVSRILARGANIDPQIIFDSYDKLEKTKKSLISVEELTDEILNNILSFISISPILNMKSGSSVVKAILLLHKLKNIHKSDKTLYSEISWLIDTIADGNIYKRPKKRNNSLPPLEHDFSARILEMKFEENDNIRNPKKFNLRFSENAKNLENKLIKSNNQVKYKGFQDIYPIQYTRNLYSSQVQD